VGDVQDLHDPEDQGKADRNHEQIGRIHKAIGQDGEGGEH
jgi:hypothetical protein